MRENYIPEQLKHLANYLCSAVGGIYPANLSA
jgi:hypothetical protein